MFVVKRDGEHQRVHFDKITARLTKLCYGLDRAVDAALVAQKVIQGLYKGVSTSELDTLAAETAASLVTEHPDYAELAARVAISNLHKSTPKRFSQLCEALAAYVEPKTGLASPLLSLGFLQFVRAHADELDDAIVHDRDYKLDYFGFRTLQRSYLLRMGGKVVERPQHMLMRVACALHLDDVQAVLESYNLMSNKWFTHASPTLFAAGSAQQQQLSSCFLLTMQEDSIEGIYETLKQCAQISKQAGGVGLAVHDVRATGSYIRGSGGASNGLVPMLRVFNNTARYVDQGGGKRKGAFAVYLEPWHADVFGVLDLKKPGGSEEHRARDLFFALWIPDLFMQRVEQDQQWSLFCPNEAPGLAEAWGDGFRTLYERYEQEKRHRKVVSARSVWDAIVQTQRETGMPYMLYKDACNAKSNQQHLGTIKSSNLCTEVVQFTSPSEIAVCNLASLNLPMFVREVRPSAPAAWIPSPTSSVSPASRAASSGSEASEPDEEPSPPNSPVETSTKSGLLFDFERLCEVTRVVTRNLNRVIDVNHYPRPEAQRSNQLHRPIGIGVQGLADLFLKLRLPFDSAEAARLNVDIFETIYFAACSESAELAAKHGPYESFVGSPMSKGQFQFDLWGVTPSARWDWDALRRRVLQVGLRNSLLVALMPTATTSQILGNLGEGFAPCTSNLFLRRTLAGEFMCVSRALVRDLCARGLWCSELKQKLLAHGGSVQRLAEVPSDLKALHKTAWEIKGRVLVDMAADRAPFVCQSQSLNAFMADPSPQKLTSMHFHAWKRGLKTGMYYLHTQPAVQPVPVTLEPALVRTVGAPSPTTSECTHITAAPLMCSRKRAKQTAETACESCSA